LATMISIMTTRENSTTMRVEWDSLS
jgi:hypothetical protein